VTDRTWTSMPAASISGILFSPRLQSAIHELSHRPFEKPGYVLGWFNRSGPAKRHN
jgi:hypothetical protein